jgi:4-hydroxybenzoate polyprenyltransferase
MRPYLLYVSGITGIVGLSFAPALSVYSTTLLFLTFFLSYGFGQALTDCFQIDTDSISSPYRPLTQGLIRKNDILIVSLIGLCIIGIILTAFAAINLFLTAIAVFGLATYTYFKKRWWAGPFYNAWIVSLLCIIAFVAGGGDVNPVKDMKFYLTIFVVFFGYANFVLSGYFKDISNF